MTPCHYFQVKRKEIDKLFLSLDVELNVIFFVVFYEKNVWQFNPRSWVFTFYITFGLLHFTFILRNPKNNQPIKGLVSGRPSSPVSV